MSKQATLLLGTIETTRCERYANVKVPSPAFGDYSVRAEVSGPPQQDGADILLPAYTGLDGRGLGCRHWAHACIDTEPDCPDRSDDCLSNRSESPLDIRRLRDHGYVYGWTSCSLRSGTCSDRDAFLFL